MTYKEIQDLIKLISKTDLTEFKLKREDIEIVIRTKSFSKGDSSVQMAQTPMVAIPQPQMSNVVAHPSQEPGTQAAPPAVEGDTAAEPVVELLEIKSPIVGTFYRASGPDKPPYKKVGDMVEAGETVCIVEAMKLFNEIESEISGKIVKVVTEDASPVEYDQVLFLVDPQG